MGRLVVINIKFNASSVPASEIFTGLPIPSHKDISEALLGVGQLAVSSGDNIAIMANGKIYSYASLNGTGYLVSGCYITNN